MTMSIPNIPSHFTLDCSDNPANFFNRSNLSFPSPLASYHVFRLAVLHFDIFLADLLSDIVVLDLNMFGFSMSLRVFRHTDCCLIVFIHGGRY